MGGTSIVILHKQSR